MTLAAGARLGPYEVLSPLGAGGMGEVYRARDTRLDRSVALKVLPEHLSGDEDVRQRFEREARAISSLQHPHICTLYDVGRSEDRDYLVMELLEGESLAQRLEKGPLPIERVLAFGIQIADALEKAHAAGIVHRDLKPGNVFLSERGVKLLDFGLAKLHAAAQQTSATVLGRLPTEQLSAPLTMAGTIMGTFQYMSPEQLEGKEADARSDLFALGCVLYEMATGKKAFTGQSQASLIGSIMSASPPPVSSLAPLTPPALDRVIATCLAKDSKDRWHTAHDVRLQLAWIAEGGSQIGLPAPVVHQRKRRERLAWGAVALLAASTAGLAVGYLRRAPAPPRIVRFTFEPPSLQQIGAPKISPDSRRVAFIARDADGKSAVWVRALDGLEMRALAGTEGASGNSRPFWSPDGRYIAFFTVDQLLKVPADGGPAQKLCDTRGADGTWSESGVILYDGGVGDPIRRVDAAGGVPRPAVEPKRGEGGYEIGWPQFLPGSDRFLYMVINGPESENGVWMGDLSGAPARRVIDGLSRVEYAPPGYLLFVRESTLVAQPFDAGSGELQGEPRPIVDGIDLEIAGGAEFSASRDGSLVYRSTGGSVDQFIWFDRKGARLGGPVETGEIRDPALSPDARWLVFGRYVRGTSDLWLRDLKRGVSSRFTSDPGEEITPLFSADGAKVLFARIATGSESTIVARPLDGGSDKVLYSGPGDNVPLAVSRDGRHLVIARREFGTAGSWDWDLMLLDLQAAGEPPGKLVPYAASPQFQEIPATFSPDDRWLAFSSNESGRSEIYVQAFPTPGRKWQISTDGGSHPVWSADGREIFFLSTRRRPMRVSVELRPSFDAGIAQPLFEQPFSGAINRNIYVVSQDGQRFLAKVPAEGQRSTPMTVVLNWAAELGAR